MENCINYRERISAFIDGALAERERVELMEHMATCPDCQAYFDDQIAIHDAFAGLEAKAPAGFADQVMARVHETKQDKKKVVAFPRWRSWAAMAACFAVVVIGVMTTGGPERNMADSQVSYSAGQSETDVVSYDTAEDAKEDITAGDDAAFNQVQTTAAPPAEDAAKACLPSLQSEEPAAMDVENAGESARLQPLTLTTGSDVARRWVEESLGQSWQPGQHYALTAEQYDALRGALISAGESFAEAPTEDASSYLLVAAE